MSGSLTVVRNNTAVAPTLSFGDMMDMGEQLVRTGFLPAHLRNGAQVAAVILTGRELGMEPMRAIRSLSLVKGKVVEAADSQLARFKADGGRATFKSLTETEAVLWIKHPNGDEHTESFTMQDARNAGLASNDNYKKFPKAMLRSRVITAALKSVGWEGAVGNYDPDELNVTPAPAAEVQGEYVHMETVEPAQLAPAPALTLEEARAMTVGKNKRVMGAMTRDDLEKLSDWAHEKGNRRVFAAAEMLLDVWTEGQADDEVELLPGSLPILEDVAA